jgi:alpha-beta hydrolase superfamily lysophospholipase
MSQRLPLLSLSFLCLAALVPPGLRAQPSEPPAPGSATQAFGETEIEFASGDLTLAGTLFMPRSAGPHPAVLLVHGDRPGERDGYRPYVQHFARNGIAALIYDRRGSGKSGGQWRGARFEEFAADALAGVRFLRDRKEIDKAWVGLWGISQGAWVIAIAAATPADVAFIVTAQPVEQRGLWQAIVGLALLSTVLTCGLAVATRRMLVRGEGSRSGRRHDAIVVGVALLFVPFLGDWHLLGL